MQTLVNRKNLKHAAVVLLFVLPAFIPLFIFWLYPIGRSIWLSFTDWDFMTPEYHFVWFKNYQALLKDSRFYAALWNTIIFTAGTLIPTIAGGLGLALLLRKNFKGSGFFKFVLFSPWITPTVAISIVWTWIFREDGGSCQCSSWYLWTSCTEMDQQFPDSYAVGHHRNSLEESWICYDFLSVRAGKSTSRIL